MHFSVSSPLPSPVTGDISREDSGDTVKSIFHSILSYNDNVMLAAVISLLLVILFVLLLHVYARWFLTQSRRRGGSVEVPRRRFQSFRVDSTFPDSPEKKGLEKSAISEIPSFVYMGKGGDDGGDGEGSGMECSICLSSFENGDVGRKLPKCGHAFHAECIEMWLFSHSSCPFCRAPVVCGHGGAAATTSLGFNSAVPGGGGGGGGGRSSGNTTSLQIVVESVPKQDRPENGDAAAAEVEGNSLPVSTLFSSPPSSSAGGLA
ncbi:PREDICTED: RING-H2 finger protein ATL63-like [Ipomoea nil]|uniref:RING-H2 finger protein ATL63-like n=1 Tax=Ipomoea nil TaxID=35883 RepID=UPI000901C1DF|nr:PREDICTED: RING-H2 finger protein ATL63-like [Ipomoea nil]